MEITNEITVLNAVHLSKLLGQCTNVPLADMESFLKYLDLQDALNKVFSDYGRQEQAILKAYNLEPPFDFSNHADRVEIEKTLLAIQSKEITVEGIRDINITALELARISIGLTNNQRNFIKSFLVAE